MLKLGRKIQRSYPAGLEFIFTQKESFPDI
jgi:hypothetical protein